MSVRDYSKQVAKRQRIRSATLIVGVDIGKVFNAAGFMDKDARFSLVNIHHPFRPA